MDLVIVRLVLVLVGLLPTGVVLLKTRGTRRLVAAGIKTKGVVAQVDGIGHSQLNSIVVTFTTRTGQRVSCRLSVAGAPYRVGQELPLIYDPADPRRMMLGWKSSYPILLVLTGAIALAFLVFAIRLDEL